MDNVLNFFCLFLGMVATLETTADDIVTLHCAFCREELAISRAYYDSVMKERRDHVQREGVAPARQYDGFYLSQLGTPACNLNCYDKHDDF